jgi:Domain of unknown function (DUF4908)
MTMKEFHAPAGGLLALMAAAALVVGDAPTAIAQQVKPAAPAPAASMNYTKSRAAAPPGVARYEDMATQRSFTLDLSGGDALMKFDDSPEVYVLRGTTAQRGDTIFRSDAGELMLRVTEQDNVISYLGDKDGAPADIVGVVTSLNGRPMTASLTRGLKDAAQRLSRLAGHDVTIFGTGEFANSEEWIADALMDGVWRRARQRDGVHERDETARRAHRARQQPAGRVPRWPADPRCEPCRRLCWPPVV